MLFLLTGLNEFEKFVNLPSLAALREYSDILSDRKVIISVSVGPHVQVDSRAQDAGRVSAKSHPVTHSEQEVRRRFRRAAAHHARHDQVLGYVPGESVRD